MFACFKCALFLLWLNKQKIKHLTLKNLVCLRNKSFHVVLKSHLKRIHYYLKHLMFSKKIIKIKHMKGKLFIILLDAFLRITPYFQREKISWGGIYSVQCTPPNFMRGGYTVYSVHTLISWGGGYTVYPP